MTNDTGFAAWLQSELDEREMSAADLARLTRKDQGMFSRILAGERQPSPETILVITKALKIPLEQGYRAAGLLNPPLDVNEDVEKILHEVSDMPEADQREVLAYIRMKNNLRKRK